MWDQAAPYNAFVNLSWLQESLGLEERANLMIAGATFRGSLKDVWTLEDGGISIRESSGVVQIESPRIYLDPAVAEKAMGLPGAVGTTTYLVDSISSGGKSTPYSFVTARSSGDAKDDEIIVNRWLADHISVGVGDSVTLAYSELAGDGFVEKKRVFRVRRIAEMKDLVSERALVPEFPGLTDVDSCEDWDIGITTDEEKLQDKPNEEYWNKYRQTPKAFVTLAAGRDMWANRYGDLMAVRVPVLDRAELKSLLDPADAGLVFRPVREQALASAAGSMDLGQLFLGMSFFLIVASLLLTAMLFVFSVEQRAKEMGLLLAVGYTPGQVRRLFLSEGFCIAALGSLAGVPLGWGFAKFLFWGIQNAWSGAVAGAPIEFHPALASAGIGVLAATLVSLIAMGLAVWGLGKRPVRELVAREGTKGITWIPLTVFILALIGALLARDFFLAGALALIAGLALFRMILLRVRGRISVRGLGLRNAARRPVRAMATAAMLACGCFMVVSVSATREDFTEQAGERRSPTGGFELVGESSIAVRKNLKELVDGVSIFPMRVRDGDDASCLNLNQSPAPTLLGVDPQKLAGLNAFGDPWPLLEKEESDGAIPAIAGDSATVTWKLGKKELEYHDDPYPTHVRRPKRRTGQRAPRYRERESSAPR